MKFPKGAGRRQQNVAMGKAWAGASAATARWRAAVILLTGVIGTAATAWMCMAIIHWQAHVAELRFAGRARDDVQTLKAGLGDATELLYSMRAYFEASALRPSRAEYEVFSQALRQRAPGLRDTGWAPRVTAAERAAFEQAVRDSGVPDFEIKERGPTGLVRAGDRPEYFPILYSDPGQQNRPVLGFDVASEPLRRAAVMKALQTREPAATPPVKLVNVARANGGMMSFIAVADRDNGIAGVVLGAFEMAAMIESILDTKIHLTGLDLYILDPRGQIGSRLIYSHSTDGKAAADEAALRAHLHWAGTLQVLDQHWEVLVTPTEAQGNTMPDWTAAMVLTGGLTTTVSIVAYLWFALRRTQQLEQLTVELQSTTLEMQRHGLMLNHLARHDTLTGLANRMAFRDELSAGLERLINGRSVALLYLDLDRFKLINDTLGHPFGDRLLCAVADRLRASVREGDVVTRLGGDEFAIAQTGMEQPGAAETLAHRLLEVIGQPYDIGGHEVCIGVSVGIAVAGNSFIDADELLRRADIALYSAKRGGRGTWSLFDPAMEFIVQQRQGLEAELRHALERSEFTLVYQPYVGIRDGEIRAFEALLRWQHPDRGIVMPGDFIRCAEETGLIAPIGLWVIHTALREAASWPAHIRVAVNISQQQLARRDLVDLIKAALQESGQPASRLELDFTETTLAKADEMMQGSLRQLRGLGVRIVMDDFGTGEASLRHLRAFPFDRIKLDGSFIAGMTESLEGATIVKAILELAGNLGIATTAEGVEGESQWEALVASGCEEAQGFLYSPPVPSEAISHLMSNWHPAVRACERSVEEGRTRRIPILAIHNRSDRPAEQRGRDARP